MADKPKYTYKQKFLPEAKKKRKEEGFSEKKVYDRIFKEGPWNTEKEKAYRKLLRERQARTRSADDAAAYGGSRLKRLSDLFRRR
jgi:hypothetical protein